MVKFLIDRPIAVTMVFLSLLVLGLVSATKLPVSLMPDIDIPEIRVQVSYPNVSARQMENTIVKPLRHQLLQVPNIEDIQSESRSGSGIIIIRFEHGANMDYAFVEANEKVDAALHSLPRDIDRPKVIRASASDIPVFNLLLTMKSDHTGYNNEKSDNDAKHFLELSQFAESVIRRRLEQIPEIAFVDMSGFVKPELYIIPDTVKIQNLGLSLSVIEKVLLDNNQTIGNIQVKEGQYQYNVRVGSGLSSAVEVGNLYLIKEDRLLQLKDIAKIELSTVKETGLCESDGKRAIVLSVIKQPKSQMSDLKESVSQLMEHFSEDYPSIDFKLAQDQSQLLDYTISNLKQSLLIGSFMAFLVMFFFLRDVKAPFLIGISIPVSVIVSLLFFRIIGLSINIISLSGLILGVGMMIDNAIIVIDNISQYLSRDKNLNNACIIGTTEVVRPLITSVLTTCAVFIPLIFLSGISGSLFYDQAMAVTIGLSVSLLVSITLLPVYFKLFYQSKKFDRLNSLFGRINFFPYQGVYSKLYSFVFNHQKLMMACFVVVMLSSFILQPMLEVKKLPDIEQVELLVHLDWNENIHVYENKDRIAQMLGGVRDLIQHENSLIGEQQFLLRNDQKLSKTSSEIYVKAGSTEDIVSVKQYIYDYMSLKFPSAKISFEKADNLFEQLFANKEAPLVAKVRLIEKEENEIASLKSFHSKLTIEIGPAHVEKMSLSNQVNLLIDQEKLLLYRVSKEAVIQLLKSSFRENQVTTLKSFQQFIPVKLGNMEVGLSELIQTSFVENEMGKEIPLNVLVSSYKGEALKTIVAGKDGEYYSFSINTDASGMNYFMDKVKTVSKEFSQYRVDFGGSLFGDTELLKELTIVMLVGLLLLYFILAAQFESLVQPLIVLTEIPINLAGVLLFLYLFDSSINIMSMIGMVVMSGIIINDSILKIDTINQLRIGGLSIDAAIHTAGNRRLKPILMTSITTILALIPFLWSNEFGAALQKPLALAVIGGLSLGTLVSLFYIPLFYRWIYSKQAKLQS